MKRLLIIPFACGALNATGMLIDRAPARAVYYFSVLIIATLATMLSSGMTTRMFSRGDRLFAAWGLVFVAYVFAALYYVDGIIGILRGGNRVLTPSLIIVVQILLNGASAAAFVMFVLAWRSTGLSQWKWWPVALGVAVALLIGGLPLLQGFQGRGVDASMLISTLGDTIGLALIVPLAMSALALRGGVLMHAWLYLALGQLTWLFFDLWNAVRADLVSPRVGVGVMQMLQIAAIMFAFIASVAQRRALAR